MDDVTKYFNQFTPHFDPRRFSFAVDFLRQNAHDDDRLLDIGCGDGATLAFLKDHTSIQHFTGMDISANYLDKVRKLVNCDVIHGSILDSHLIARYKDSFDYALLGSVVHHLIGRTRSESLQKAMMCFDNAWSLLKSGGYLMIYEPAHEPQWLMSVVFWIKKIVGSFSTGRLEIRKKWFNIGQPIVSYYTRQQIMALLEILTPQVSMEVIIIDQKKYGGIIQRSGLGLIVRKG